MAQINFKDYLESMVGLLISAQVKGSLPIQAEYNVEPLGLDMDTAIPVGLITNELISNCLKYAFNGRSQGRIGLSLLLRQDSQIELVVRDDGVGLPAGFNPDTTSSLGIRLVKMLCRQLRASLEYQNHEGAEFRITFKCNHLDKSL